MRPNDLIDVDPGYVQHQINPNNLGTGILAGAGAARPLIEKMAGSDASTVRSMERYLRSQIHHDYPGLDLEALKKEMQGLYGTKARVLTQSEIQDALKAIKGSIPGQPAVDLSAYETVPKPTTMSGKTNKLLKKTGEYVEDLNPFTGSGMGSKAFRTAGRGAVGFGAGYEGSQAINDVIAGNYGAAIPHASSAGGYGALLSTNPKIKGAGAVLAATPLLGNLIGTATAAPMSKEEAGGTAFDLGTALLGMPGLALTPSELGAGTIQPKREVYHPGMSVLHGTKLHPQAHAQGGLVHLAEGGSPLPNVNFDIRSMPNMTGMPGVGYMQTPAGAMARLQAEKEMELARLRAGVSGMAMSIPGQHGIKTVPGQMDIGANIPLGLGNLDISANRSINPMPGRGHMQGVNARYTLPFKNGGKV
jgi:hypothetical protein